MWLVWFEKGGVPYSGRDLEGIAHSELEALEIADLVMKREAAFHGPKYPVEWLRGLNWFESKPYRDRLTWEPHDFGPTR